MVVNKLVTVQMTTDTRERLGQIAEQERRSMTKQLEVLVFREWVRLFGNVPGKDVVGVDELPGPEDAKGVPVIYVQPIQE